MAEEMTRVAELGDARGVVLGKMYTDRVTGIKGYATTCTLSLTGCDQVTLLVVPGEDSRDPSPYHLTVDATRLKELVEDGEERPQRNGPPEVIARIR